MVFYIDIVKFKKTELLVQYKFYTSEENIGIVEIRKSDGNVIEIQPAPNDSLGRLFERTVWALIRPWKKGEYPEKTCWAS